MGLSDKFSEYIFFTTSLLIRFSWKPYKDKDELLEQTKNNYLVHMIPRDTSYFKNSWKEPDLILIREPPLWAPVTIIKSTQMSFDINRV